MNALPQTTVPVEPTDTPQRRFLDNPEPRVDQTPTLVGGGCDFTGQLRCAGDLTIAGQGHGTAHLGGTFVLSAQAIWEGDVHCQHAVLAGRFTGCLQATGKVEVRASARVEGQLHALHMAIATGALIAADIVMSGDASPQSFQEKRGT